MAEADLSKHSSLLLALLWSSATSRATALLCCILAAHVQCSFSVFVGRDIFVPGIKIRRRAYQRIISEVNGLCLDHEHAACTVTSAGVMRALMSD